MVSLCFSQVVLKAPSHSDEEAGTESWEPIPCIHLSSLCENGSRTWDLWDVKVHRGKGQPAVYGCWLSMAALEGHPQG